MKSNKIWEYELQERQADDQVLCPGFHQPGNGVELFPIRAQCNNNSKVLEANLRIVRMVLSSSSCWVVGWLAYDSVGRRTCCKLACKLHTHHQHSSLTPPPSLSARINSNKVIREGCPNHYLRGKFSLSYSYSNTQIAN